MSKVQFFNAKFKSKSTGVLSEQGFVGLDASEVMELINDHCIEEGKLLLDVFIVPSGFDESNVVEFNPNLRIKDLDITEDEKEAIYAMIEDMIEEIEDNAEHQASFPAANDDTYI